MELILSNILLACNKSSNFDSLLSLSANLASKFNAKLHVLLSNIELDAVKDKLSGVDNNVQTVNGLNTKFVLQKAEELEADLIIISTSTKDVKEGLFSFTDAIKVIDNAKKPVLTIPGNCQVNSFSKILIPIDTSYETRQKGPLTIGIGKKYNAIIHIVGVSGDKDKDSETTVNNYSRQVRNKINENGLDTILELRLGGNITNQTLAYANEIKPDLVVIMTEQESNLASFFTGKYSEQFVKLAPYPILNINPIDLIVSDARL
jgi:nucleotide-binding universal stress UspA family protein